MAIKNYKLVIKKMENLKEKKERVIKFFGQVLGWICIVVGIFGLFMPFFQGIIFILVGIIFLSATYPKLKIGIENQFAKGKTRHPKIAKILSGIEKIYAKLVAIFETKA